MSLSPYYQGNYEGIQHFLSGLLLYLQCLEYLEHRWGWHICWMNGFPAGFEKSVSTEPSCIPAWRLVNWGKLAERKKSPLVHCFSGSSLEMQNLRHHPRTTTSGYALKEARWLLYAHSRMRNIAGVYHSLHLPCFAYLYHMLVPLGIWICDPAVESNTIIFMCERVDTVIIDFVYNKGIGESLFIVLTVTRIVTRIRHVLDFSHFSETWAVYYFFQGICFDLQRIHILV